MESCEQDINSSSSKNIEPHEGNPIEAPIETNINDPPKEATSKELDMSKVDESQANQENKDKDELQDETKDTRTIDHVEENQNVTTSDAVAPINNVVETMKNEENGEAIDANTKQNEGVDTEKVALEPTKVEDQCEGKETTNEETKKEEPTPNDKLEEVSSEARVKTDEKSEEEVPNKPTPRQSNNILSKVKHSFNKVKNALIRTPSTVKDKQKPIEDHKQAE